MGVLDMLPNWISRIIFWEDRISSYLIQENDMEEEIEFEEMIIMEDEDGVETVEFLSDVLEEAEEAEED